MIFEKSKARHVVNIKKVLATFNKIAQGDVNIFSQVWLPSIQNTFIDTIVFMQGQNHPKRRLSVFKKNLYFCSHFDFFGHFHKNYSSNRQNIIKFVISGSEKVEIDT